jgi:hypothetical protein
MTADEIADAEPRHLHVVGRQRLRGRAAAAIRNADDLGAPLVVEPFEEQIGVGAFAERGVVQALGLRLRQRLQLRDRVDVDRRGGEQALDQEEQPRHRDDIGVGVVGQVAEQERIKRHGRVVDDADRVAVAGCLRAGLAAKDAGGAADVLDHQRLAKPGLQFARRRA